MGGVRTVYKISFGKPKRKDHFGEMGVVGDSVTLNLRRQCDSVCVDRIALAQDG
jgi:hypothetical protein